MSYGGPDDPDSSYNREVEWVDFGGYSYPISKDQLPPKADPPERIYPHDPRDDN